MACTRTLTRAGKSIYLNRRNYPLKRRPVSIVDTFVRHCNSDASASASPFSRFALLLLLRCSWLWFLRWRSCRARAQSWGERDGRVETARQRACVQADAANSQQTNYMVAGWTEDWRIDGEVSVIESKEYLLHSSKKWTNYLQNWRKKCNILICAVSQIPNFNIKKDQTVKTKKPPTVFCCFLIWSQQHVPWVLPKNDDLENYHNDPNFSQQKIKKHFHEKEFDLSVFPTATEKLVTI